MYKEFDTRNLYLSDWEVPRAPQHGIELDLALLNLPIGCVTVVQVASGLQTIKTAGLVGKLYSTSVVVVNSIVISFGKLGF
jgi:hypothetical protein